MIRKVLLAAAAAAVLVAAFAGCDRREATTAGNPSATARIVVPGIATDAAHTASRTYGMGFFMQSSVPTVAAILDTVPKMARVSDYMMIQREVPWTKIAAGKPFETILEEDYTGIVKLLRGHGLKIVLLVDPLDGLNRKSESIEALKNGRTLKDPATRAIHEAWVRALVASVKPDYIGLASEINTLGAHGDAALYQEIRAMCNRLAPEIRQLSPTTKVFVSFQVDDAWQVPPWPKSEVDQFAMSRDFDVDVVGLSSYPGFSFVSPADIPIDYYRRFQEASGKPLLMAEGGWGSAGGPNNSPANQAAYYHRMLDLLDGVQAELAILLLYQDLNLADPAWGLPPERAAILQHFTTMGIVDVSGAVKPVFAVWSERFQRPLRRP